MDSLLRWPWGWIAIGLVLGIAVDFGVRAYTGEEMATDFPVFVGFTLAAALLGLLLRRAEHLKKGALAGAMAIGVGQFLAWFFTTPETDFVS